MKNKKLVYILLPLAVVIWGFIVFRIIQYVNRDNQLIQPGKTFIPQLSDTTLADNFSIVANYPDPFKRSIYSAESKATTLKSSGTRSNSISRNNTTKRTRWPNITYGGIIENNQQNEIIAIVTIDNKNCLIRIGEEMNEVKVIQIYTDSLRVKYQEELRTITKSNE